VSSPICTGLACSSTAAVMGMAINVTCAPKELLKTEIQRRR
jgi:hypothetical protein